jgi:hypothetical protein
VFTVQAENRKGIGPESAPSNTLTVPDPTPRLTSTSPVDGATNVAIGANVTATFTVNVAGATAPGAFILRNAGGATIAATVTYNAATRTATLNPNANLVRGVTYTAILTGGTATIRNAATNTPMARTTFSFTTDNTAPVVLGAGSATNPLAGATGVNRAANVVTEISEVVTGVTNARVTLRQGTAAAPVGAVLTATVTVANVNGHSVITLNPQVANLLANTNYTLRTLNGIVDTSGNALAPTARTFRTGP